MARLMSEDNQTQIDPRTAALRAIVDAILEAWSMGQEGEVRLDSDGEAVIEIHEDVQVSIQVPEGSERVLAFAPIAPLPDDYQARIAVIEGALRFNLAQQTLGGGAVGTDPDGGALFFAGSAPAATFAEGALGELLRAAFASVILMREEIGFDPNAERIEADDDTDEEQDQLLKV